MFPLKRRTRQALPAAVRFGLLVLAAVLVLALAFVAVPRNLVAARAAILQGQAGGYWDVSVTYTGTGIGTVANDGAGKGYDTGSTVNDAQVPVDLSTVSGILKPGASAGVTNNSANGNTQLSQSVCAWGGKGGGLAFALFFDI